jgi:hypothetical protein
MPADQADGPSNGWNPCLRSDGMFHDPACGQNARATLPTASLRLRVATFAVAWGFAIVHSIAAMNRQPHQNDDSWENDPVWKLLDQSSPATASPRFADDTVRAARLAGQEVSWWSRVLTPLPLAGFAAAATACVIAVLSLQNDTPGDAHDQIAAVDSISFADIQEIAETEALLSAVDHLDKFSDVELVSLIGF